MLATADSPAPIGQVKCRCPRCGSRDLVACEITEASMLFDITAGVMTRLSHTDNFEGFARVELSCKRCDHQWKPRRVGQVMALLVEN